MKSLNILVETHFIGTFLFHELETSSLRIKLNSLEDVYRNFGRWSEALRAAGYDAVRNGFKIPTVKLLEDYGNVCRKMGRVAVLGDYNANGRFGTATYQSRFGAWSGVRKAFWDFAEGKEEWADVRGMMEAFAEANEMLDAGCLMLDKGGGRRPKPKPSCRPRPSDCSPRPSASPKVESPGVEFADNGVPKYNLRNEGVSERGVQGEEVKPIGRRG